MRDLFSSCNKTMFQVNYFTPYLNMHLYFQEFTEENSAPYLNMHLYFQEFTEKNSVMI